MGSVNDISIYVFFISRQLHSIKRKPEIFTKLKKTGKAVLQVRDGDDDKQPKGRRIRFSILRKNSKVESWKLSQHQTTSRELR